MKKIFKRVAAVVTALSVMAAAVVFDVPERILALAAAETRAETQNCSGNHTGWTEFTSTTTLEDGKKYYLTDDVALGNADDGDEQSKQPAIEIDNKKITLCLNNHTISIQEGVQARIFFIKGNGSLTLCDCQGGGKLTGGNASLGSGGAVYVYSGSFNMYGGTISDNNAAQYGGGVYVTGGKFIMTSGTISGNTASTSGGVFVSSATFKMSGGTIGGTSEADKNTAGYGGGVYVNGKTF